MENSFGLSLQSDSGRYTWGYFLDDVASRFADKEAIRFEGQSISFNELRQQSRQLAKSLAAAGVVKGTRVAVYMANRPEFVVTSFAVALVGAVLVPVNTFATADEREYILRHSDASVLLFSAGLLKYDFLGDLKKLLPEYRDAVPGQLYSEKLPYLRRLVCLGLEKTEGAFESWSDFFNFGNQFPDSHLDAMTSEVYPSDDGIIIYTSGSTSRPKGVLHRQRAPAIMSWRFADDLRYNQDDRIWTAYPFFWSAGIAMGLGALLGSGAVLVLQEVFDAEQALRMFVDEKVTGIQAWPHHEKALAEHPLAQELDLPRMSKLDLSSPFAALAGVTEDKWGIFGSYGMTETFTLVSNIPADSPADLREKTAGRPLPGNQIKILDENTGVELPVGESGEIVVKGPSMMVGYYKVDPEKYLDANGFYHTQDRGHFDENGYLYWSGRMSNMIKTGGANVSPLEIEYVLKSYPNLRAGIPFGAPHPTLGEAIVLCAVPTEGHSLDEEDIQAFLKSKLAGYKRPKAVLLFEEKDLALTGSQKVQSNKLIEKALERMRRENYVIEGVNYGEYLS